MGPMTFAALCAAHPRLCAVQSTPVKPVASQPAARPSRTLPDGGGPRRTRSSHRGGPGPAGQSKPAPSSTPTQQGGGGRHSLRPVCSPAWLAVRHGLDEPTPGCCCMERPGRPSHPAHDTRVAGTEVGPRPQPDRRRRARLARAGDAAADHEKRRTRAVHRIALLLLLGSAH